MNKNINISDQEKIAIINYLSGGFSLTDSEILNHWLGKNENNKLLFDQFSDIWNAGIFKKTEEKINVNKAWEDIQDLIGKNDNQFNWKSILRYAAVFILALVFGGTGYYLLEKNRVDIFNQQMVEYMAPLGSRSFVQLADGSKVWLNAGTTLKYQNSYGKNNRNLQLEGEAFFEVVKNTDLPFTVKTSDIDVIAVGTKFNVKAYNEENTIETTLVEGLVKLESSTVKLAGNIFLKPNEKAVFTKKNGNTEIVSSNKTETLQSKPKLEVIQSIETAPIVSWKDQRWVIQNEKLGELAKKLERRFNVNFIFDDEVLKEFYFGGTLEDESLEQIMQAISYASPVKYIIQDNNVIITPDGNKINKFKKLLME